MVAVRVAAELVISPQCRFEDHALHEYMALVAEQREWENTPFESEFADDFGHFASLADVFRQIGHDELVHKIEKDLMKEARFR